MRRGTESKYGSVCLVIGLIIGGLSMFFQDEQWLSGVLLGVGIGVLVTGIMADSYVHNKVGEALASQTENELNYRLLMLHILEEYESNKKA